MKTKIITTVALAGAFLASGSAFAWSKHVHAHSHGKVKVIERIVTHTHVKPGNWHSHPKNGLTNDTYHTHPNGKNHHVHHYGTGGHKHAGYSYLICPYEH